MLNVKSEKCNPFKPKNEKRREFWRRLQTKLSSWFRLDFHQNFVLYRMKVISGRSIIKWIMVIFSPQPLNKLFYLFFRQSDNPPLPPRKKSQNVKMRNFCNGF